MNSTPMTPAPEPDFRLEAAAGFLAILPVVFSVAAYGLIFGTLAIRKGLSPLEVFVMSATVFAGGSQFIAVELWSTPIAVWTITVAALLVNLRHVMMGAAFVPALEAWPGKQVLGALFFMADENWALAMRRAAECPLTPAYYAAMASALYLTWTVSTTSGALLGGVFVRPERWGLDFAFAAIFLVLLVGLWRGVATNLRPWLAAAATAVAVHHVISGAWFVIAGAIAGTLVAALRGEARR